jgi:Mg-chelatase subunit ChlD
MSPLKKLVVVLLLTIILPTTPPAAAKRSPPQVEVCFVLDTTGSMSGLIEGAKAKIWSIANQMIAAKPMPELRIALIGYRDRGDEYVTRIHDLSDDIDSVYAHLQEFQAAGGGDLRESVNQALYEAVTEISWNPSRDVLKIVFLVGDCPPHMDYDEVQYPKTCKLAVRNDLIVNTVQCGSHSATTPIWREIADAAEGSFTAIKQTGNMQVIETPMDAELAGLNVELGNTIVAYGSSEMRQLVLRKQARAEESAAPSVADRLAYNAATGKVVQGGGDLVDGIRSGAVDLDDLEESELPPALRKMSPGEREIYLEAQATKRARLQAEIDELLNKRQAYIDAETARLAAEGAGDSFDHEVSKMLRSQAKRKGIIY